MCVRARARARVCVCDVTTVSMTGSRIQQQVINYDVGTMRKSSLLYIDIVVSVGLRSLLI